MIMLLREMGLLGATLAGYKYADTLNHLRGRARPLRQKDISTGRAIERVDCAGDDHGRQTGLQLFSAADKLVAVHLGHDEVAKQKIERSGKRLLYNLQGLL